MTEMIRFIPALCAGVVLGLLYFGGLWLTVRRVATSRRPVLLFLGSFVVRTAVVAAGFYWVMEGEWSRAIACLAGFLIARTVLMSRIRPDRLTPTFTAGEAVSR